MRKSRTEAGSQAVKLTHHPDSSPQNQGSEHSLLQPTAASGICISILQKDRARPRIFNYCEPHLIPVCGLRTKSSLQFPSVGLPSVGYMSRARQLPLQPQMLLKAEHSHRIAQLLLHCMTPRHCNHESLGAYYKNLPSTSFPHLLPHDPRGWSNNPYSLRLMGF